jgi:amino acid adenylation domain-containing protein
MDSPGARLQQVIDDCQPALVVVPATGEEPSGFTAPARATVPELVGQGGSTPALSTDAARDAYLIYTSGTTGRPKGVRVPVAAMTWAVQRAAEAMGLGPTTRAMAVSAFHFDGSYGAVFPTLVAGGRLLVPRREELLFLSRFCQLVVDDGVNYTSFSPSYLRLLVSSRHLPKLAGSQLSTMALGGEECAPADIEKLWEVLPSARVFNRYGPTETAIAVTTYEVSRADVAGRRVPIGAPHPGVEFFVVDDHGHLVSAPGERGELYIGGRQLMSGYFGDEDLSSAVLRRDVVPGRLVYKTGDLVYRDKGGLYVYAGRLDDVVKRNGVRLSLGEVAQAFRDAPGVKGAASALVGPGNGAASTEGPSSGPVGGSAKLVVFVEAEAGVTAVGLVEAARARLPESMLPDEVVLVEALPMTAQGKLDRRRLLADAGLTAWSGA